MCFSSFQLPYGKIFSDALKDSFFAHRIGPNAPAIHRQRHHQAPGWLKNLVEKYTTNVQNSSKKITAKSSKVFSVSPTNARHLEFCRLSMIFLHPSLCPEASKATSSPCSENEPSTVPQQRCSLFWAMRLICVFSIVLQMAT